MSEPTKAVFLSYAREDTRRRQGYGGQAGRIRLLIRVLRGFCD